MTRRVTYGIQIVFTFADFFFFFLEIRFKFGWELVFQTKLKDLKLLGSTHSSGKVAKKKKKSSASRTLYCEGVTVTDKKLKKKILTWKKKM